jgi:glycerophosphoryl diester phosphodiesterase
MMLLAAHRGSSGTAPENTIAAFREAADAGADLIELDVRLTRDRHPVVMHDRTLRRTTGSWGTIERTSLPALRRLDAGAWFSPRFTGERIPTLKEVLETLPGDIGLNLEMKTDGDRLSRLAFARRLLDTIRGHRTGRLLIVSSFDHRILGHLRRLDSRLTLGVLAHPVRDLARTPSALAARYGAAWYFCSRSMLRRRRIENAHAHGLRIGVYTVNRSEHLAQLQRYGVDLVFTNYPAALRAALE